MYVLSNAGLTVSILDPIADQARMGVRYCTGGYIFQIDDARHGPLLSGPTYPDSFNWFDGQGIPDAFNLSPLRAPSASDSNALIIGVGMCDLQQHKVSEFCQWEVQQEQTAISMRTIQVFEHYALELERTVTLHGRSIGSRTRLKNTGDWAIPIRWFPHPFFPHTDSNELCRLNIAVGLADSPYYVLGPSGFISLKMPAWPDGAYQALDHDAQTSLGVLQRHPELGLVAATCSYVPSFFPIWGNPRTFSWEPFFERTVAPGQETSWSIVYDF